MALAALAGCGGGSEACTEIGCESSATVEFQTSIPQAYDLQVRIGGETLTARCNDPDSMEAVDNPEDLECDARGFTIIGPRGESSSAMITVVDATTEEAIFANISVQLATSADGTLQPNGPDCPPVCYERFGQLIL